MKTKLERPMTAWMITVLVVLFAALLGGRASLGRMRAEAWSLYAGGAGTPMGQGSIQSDLGEIAADARNLITVAERYLQTEDPLLAAIRTEAENITANPVPETCALSAEYLRTAVEELNTVLANAPASAEDEQYRNELIAKIRSGYRIIENSAYNALAADFNRELDRMPAVWIAELTGVERLRLYDDTLLRD